VLSQNYRSTQQILDAANALMSEGSRQHRKTLMGLRQATQKPVFVTLEDAQAQAEYIVGKLLATREVGGSLKRHAILFRSSHHSDVLELELARRNIPFVKYGGLKFLEAAHVKDMLSILRWVDNPRNAVAGFRVLKLVPGFGPAHAKKALEHFEAQSLSVKSLAAFDAPQLNKMDWKPYAKKVVVLVGDSPPRTEDFAPLLALIRQFKANNGTFNTVDVAAEEHERFEREFWLKVHREEPPKISPLPAFYRQTQAAYKVLATAGGGSMKSLTKDAHINQQVLILAFGDQWQSQVSAFGRGLNQSSGGGSQ